MRWKILIALFCSTLNTWANVDTSAIVTRSEVTLTIKDLDNVEFEMFQTVQVLSEKGRGYAQQVYYEDIFQEADFYNITVKDQNETVIAQYDKKDFKKTSVIEAVYSYEDINQFYLDCGLKTYPYSIEMHVLIKQKNFFGRSYNLGKSEGTFVINPTFEIIYPKDYKLRYEIQRPDLIKVDTLGSKSDNILKFSMNSFIMSSGEGYMPESVSPVVDIIPEIFEFGNIRGSLTSWQEYGIWYNSLWKGRAELSKESMAAFDALIAANPVKGDLAKAIYKYTQQNLRYVYIGYGLGGHQTMSAKETAKLGYGDCKALTNFTAAAMNYAGIDAYPALVNSGEWPAQT